MTRKNQPFKGYRRDSTDTGNWLDKFARNGLGLTKFVKGDDLKNTTAMIDETWAADDPPFRNVVVGHWIMCGQFVSTTTRAKSYMCVSKCGVVAMYPIWDVTNGKLPQTCYGCRAGEHSPPSTRCVEEKDLPKLKSFWEKPMPTNIEMQHAGALRGKESHDVWFSDGRDLMIQIAEATGFGKHFGWKASVESAKPHPQKKSKNPRARVFAVHLKERKVEIHMQPADCEFEFRAFLSTPRSDVEFANIAERIKEAVAKVCPDEKPKLPVVSVAAAAIHPIPEVLQNGHTHMVVDMDAVNSLMSKLATVQRVGKDINDMAGAKLVARQKLNEAEENKRQAYIIMIDADERMKKSNVELEAHKDRVNELEMKLRNAMQERAKAAEENIKAIQAFDVAREYHTPAERLAAAANKELQEIEQLEAQSMKEVGDVATLTALLKALGNVKA